MLEMILIIVGGMLNWFSRIYKVAVGKYKTYLLKKKNPEMAYVGFGLTFNKNCNVSIGKNSYINGGILYTRENAQIIIGNNVMIADNVVLRTDMHNYDNYKLPMIEQGICNKNIVIEDDVWIGWGAYIMPGTHIHRGAIIGAGAVVTHDVSEFAIVGGVPAQEITYRSKK